MDIAAPAVLFTIGYEGYSTPQELAGALVAAGVGRVVDVRELPISRRRGFAKTALAATLASAGIRYEHERALGNPFRDLYRAGRPEEGERRYRTHLEGVEASPAVDALAGSLDGAGATCLLCLEANPAACHRSIVAAEVARRRPGARVVHL